MNKKIKWVAFQPLVGGFSIGADRAFQCKPEFIISYEGFIKNDRHLLNYWKEYKIPYLVLKYGSNEFVDPEHQKIFNKLNKNIDVVVGVPICSGLSRLNVGGQKNSDKKMGSNAVQNENIYMMTEFTLNKINPKVMCAENAPGLYTKTGEGVQKKLYEIATNNDFVLSLYKTDTQLHGIPQKRKRTFFFMWNDNAAPLMGWYKRERKNLTEFLNDIPKDLTYQNYEEQTEKLNKEFSYQFLKYKLGDDFRSIQKHNMKTGMQYIEKHLNCAIEFAEKIGNDKGKKLVEHAKYKLSIGKEYWDWSIHLFDEVINAVISRNMVNGVHPKENRYITLREYMSLMGMPYNFQLVDDYKHAYAITQNVPVCTAKDMCKEIIKYLNRDLYYSKCRFLKQNNDYETIEEIEKIENKLF